MSSRNINYTKYKIIILLVLFLAPWFNGIFSDDISAVELGTEDLSFYEINPCKVSLFEYLSADFQSVYKNHYFFRFNDYSSISCFGRISGVTLINNTFYISVGTNSLVNIVILTLFWIILISIIKKDEKIFNTNQLIYNLSILITSLYFVFLIFSERRFYEQKLYMLNLDQPRSYLILFIIFFFVIKIFNDIFFERMSKIINYFPLIFLFIGVLSGFNLTIYCFLLINMGIISIMNLNNKKLNFLLVTLVIFWSSNASSRFSFYPDKLRGFTSSSYSLNSSFAWAVLFLLIINGLIYLYKNTHSTFDIDKFIRNYIISAFSILTLGLLGSNLPLINFLNYYYFGQQKYGVKYTNPFLVDIFNNNEKIAWRGFYPSAESVGEFYGLLILLIIFKYFSRRVISKFELFGLLSSALGLYFSNNKTVFLIIMFVITFLSSKKLNINKYIKLAFMLFFILIAVYVIGYSNLTYPYEFSSVTLYDQGNKYVHQNETSSAMNYINENFQEGSGFFYIFGFFGYISYLLNRSELWGLFSARYNPSIEEFLFGTGPLNLAKHYGEVTINEPGSLLLPHSSLLSSLLFFGFLGLLGMISLLIYSAYKSKDKINTFGIILFLFIFINLIKSDSINYFSSFALYTYILLTLFKLKNTKLFKI